MRTPIIVALCLGTAMTFLACHSQQTDPRPTTSAVVPAAAASTPAPAAKRTTTGEATLLLMADIRGVLRPCGCTVDLQKGGFERLGPHLEAERQTDPRLHLLHAGPLFYEKAKVDKSKKAQRARQVEVAADLIGRVGIDTVALTAVDLAGSKGKLDKLMKVAKVGATVGNIAVKEGEAYPRYLIRTVGDLKVGIFALASPDHAAPLSDKATISPPRDAARAILAEMGHQVDVVVFLSALGLRETKRLVRKVPGIHFAIAGGLGEHPVHSDEAELVGQTRVMQFHREGRFIGRLAIRMIDGQTDFVDASAPSDAEIKALTLRIESLQRSLKRWKREGLAEDDKAVRSAQHHLDALTTERSRLTGLSVTAPGDRSSFGFRVTALNWDLPQDPEILKLMDAFDEELKTINLASVGKLPEPKPGEAVYVGVDECLGCHEETQTFWENDQHHHAWETLVDLKKTFDVECVSCHVTGYGKAGGSTLGKTKDREDVQCEACHGPGSIHAETGEASDIVADPGEDLCVTCHNAHHSPKFDFATWKRRIIVPGHGLPLE